MAPRKTGLAVLADILSNLEESGGSMPKSRLMWLCHMSYNNPRWSEVLSKGWVTVDEGKRRGAVARLTEKGRKVLNQYRALDKSVSGKEPAVWLPEGGEERGRAV